MPISLSVLAFRSTSFCPKRAAATSTFFVNSAALEFAGFTRKPITATLGTTSCNSSTSFGDTSTLIRLTPVRLPPGRLRLSTRPRLTGSLGVEKTIGMVAVAALAASAAGVVPATITDGCRVTSSAASAGSSSFLFSAQRYSIATFWPSTKPVSLRPMSANGMVRPCSCPASVLSWPGAPKTRSTPCLRSSIPQSP